MRRVLSKEDWDRVRAAITAAEANTQAEIVCVLARRSSEYGYVPVIWAMGIALAMPLPLVLLTGLPASTIYAGQLALFLLLSIALSPMALRMHLVPQPLRRRHAHERATQQFLARGLTRTEKHTGVLIYVSMAERYAEVIADSGVYRHADPAVWQRTIERLTDGMKAGTPGQALVDAIEICGRTLAELVPPVPGQVNELPDRVVEI